MIGFEEQAYDDVQVVLRRYGEKLLDAGFSALRSREEKQTILVEFMKKFKLRENDILSPYESTGYYLVDGSSLTKEQYTEMILFIEDRVQNRLRPLLRVEAVDVLRNDGKTRESSQKRKKEWRKTIKELALLAFAEYEAGKHRSMRKAAEAMATKYLYNGRQMNVDSLYKEIKDLNTR